MARTTAEWYTVFAEREASGQSAIYEGWARGVAADAETIALIERLPTPKRQPNLIFATSRLLGAPEGGYPEWRDWLHAHWTRVEAEAEVRMTQTNEPRRCAVLVPALALIDGPVALLEVGASAGLTLFPDRYSYSWDGRRLDPVDGPSTVLLECATTGNPPIPQRMPEIVWRAGLDLHPLDLRRVSDTLWLETLIWPEQHERRARIRAAMEIARADPPHIVAGDAVGVLPALAATAPAGATLVIVTSAAIVYLMPEPRARLLEMIRGMDARWISNEGAGIVPSVGAGLEGHSAPRPGLMALGLDGRALAWTGPHGQSLDWIAHA